METHPSVFAFFIVTLCMHSGLLILFVIQSLVQLAVSRAHSVYNDLLRKGAVVKTPTAAAAGSRQPSYQTAFTSSDPANSSHSHPNGAFGFRPSITTTIRTDKKLPALPKTAPPTIGPLKTWFNRVGVLICILQVMWSIDFCNIWGILGREDFSWLMNNATALLLISVAACVHYFTKFYCEIVFKPMPRVRPIVFMVLAAISWFLLNFNVLVKQVWTRDSRYSGYSLLWLAFVEFTYLITFNITVLTLRNTFLQTDSLFPTNSALSPAAVTSTSSLPNGSPRTPAAQPSNNGHASDGIEMQRQVSDTVKSEVSSVSFPIPPRYFSDSSSIDPAPSPPPTDSGANDETARLPSSSSSYEQPPLSVRAASPLTVVVPSAPIIVLTAPPACASPNNNANQQGAADVEITVTLTQTQTHTESNERDTIPLTIVHRSSKSYATQSIAVRPGGQANVSEIARSYHGIKKLALAINACAILVFYVQISSAIDRLTNQKDDPIFDPTDFSTCRGAVYFNGTQFLLTASLYWYSHLPISWLWELRKTYTTKPSAASC